MVTSGCSSKKRKHPDVSPSLTMTGGGKSPSPCKINLIHNEISPVANKPPKMNWDLVRSKVLSANLTIAVATITGLRNKMEILHSTEYPSMLASLLPSFVTVMKAVPCIPPPLRPLISSGSEVINSIQGSSEEKISPQTKASVNSSIGEGGTNGGGNYSNNNATAAHHVRNSILELCSRLPQNEYLRPYVPSLLSMAMDVLQKDYETNALVAFKIIFDLHKNYRPMLIENIQPFLDFVSMSYRNLGTTVQRNFFIPSVLPQPQQPLQPQQQQQQQQRSYIPITTPGVPTIPNGTQQLAQPTIPTITNSPSGTALPLNRGLRTSDQVTPPKHFFLKASMSFRVLTECPLTVMLLFQLYPKRLKNSISQLLPLMMDALIQRPPPRSGPIHVPPVTQHGSGGSMSGMSPIHQNMYYTRTRELLAAQAKTLSFVTYLIRGFADQMRPYEDHIASSILKLLTLCPREALSTRKELLVALRHIIATDFRRGFFPHVDRLLDERILVGTHRQSEYTHLRPIAYSAIAELLLHMRQMLSLVQISRVVLLFSRVLHDMSMNLTLVTQTTCVRLLLNMVDFVFHNKEDKASLGRDVLYRILENLVLKLGMMVEYGISKVKKSEEQRQLRIKRWENLISCGEKNNVKLSPDTFKGKEEQKGRDRINGANTIEIVDSMQHVCDLVKSILVGMKTVIYCINNYGAQREKLKASKDKKTDKKSDTGATLGNIENKNSRYEDVAMQKITLSERQIVDKYIEWGLKSAHVFKLMSKGNNDEKSLQQEISPKSPDSSLNKPSSNTKYIEILEIYASSFTVLDGFNFQRIIGPRLEFLFNATMDDYDVVAVHNFFLTKSSTISYDCAACLVKFLSSKMEKLSLRRRGLESHLFNNQQVNEMVLVEKNERVILILFEAIFSSMSAFPKNEAVLRPHLQVIVSDCLSYTMELEESTWPGIYASILCSLFRSIAGGKFEESYKQLLPLLPTLLNGLYRIYCSTENTILQHAIIELCLTVPARLSSLLPHLHLLIRVIIPALQTKYGELINLGLRTLEFWIDNLNPDFLFPILSRQTRIFSDLMLSLTKHLRPAPYPYGLLTLRLLGKLGGMNRHFLTQPMDIEPDNSLKVTDLSFECSWPSSDDGDSAHSLKEEQKHNFDMFAMPLPLQHALKVLKLIVNAPEPSKQKKVVQQDCQFNRDSLDVALSGKVKMENLDLDAYKIHCLEEIKTHQAKAAFTVLQSALAAIVDINLDFNELSIPTGGTPNSEPYEGKTFDGDEGARVKRHVQPHETKTEKSLKLIFEGLFHSTRLECLKKDAILLLKGISTHIVLVFATHADCVIRVDANGDDAYGPHQNDIGSHEAQIERGASLSNGKQQPLVPFGCFRFIKSLDTSVNLFCLNESIANILTEENEEVRNIALHVIEHIADLFQQDLTRCRHTTTKSNTTKPWDGVEFFFESLLHYMCQTCLASLWKFRPGVYDGICKIIGLMGMEWCRRFEVAIMHVALSCVKSSPSEIASANIDALRFYWRVCWYLYGCPSAWNSNSDILIHDTVSLPHDINLVPPFRSRERSNIVEKTKYKPPKPPNSGAILSMLVSELGSTKQLVRFAVRHGLNQIYSESDNGHSIPFSTLLKNHTTTIKRLLFSRSLYNLPVPDQIAVVEAVAFIVEKSPRLIPLSDSRLPAFLKDLLKMMSVADGEMTSDSISISNGAVVNKDGYSPVSETNSSMVNASSSLSHASGLFLRKEFILEDPLIPGRIVVPCEMPTGVQLRVSSLLLFRSVIKGYTNTFFDAAVSTSIGNIRPHVISLLFRSLTSRPQQAVHAAHVVLRDALSLSAINREGNTSHQPVTHRLPKELLQTCIRPVLLNLRDYTKLSVPLLRGLSRLLSLLSSWFSKTLGEKLLDHLQQWGNPDRIIGHQIWKTGEEPLVAAAIIELFELLPDASHFVEPLVKTIIKLEVVLPRYKACLVQSPYRAPLAKYLNKHCAAVASFFINDHRLKNPIYSDLLQDIVKRADVDVLRAYLSCPDCSNTLLNVCFERPLAIIRSDKNSQSTSNSPLSVAERLSVHGISVDNNFSNLRQKEIGLRQYLEIKQKELQRAKVEEAQTKKILQNLIRTGISSPESSSIDNKTVINNAKKKHQQAHAILEKAKKETNKAHQEYSNELAKSRNDAQTPNEVIPSQDQRSMSLDALELQLQGFCLVETLISKNKNYIHEHHDIARAFRWLWRSKGRHLRLLHEDSVPPRYNGESKFLAKFLVQYAKTYPNDVDVLFDLLRIFLQPTATDFSFVKSFLDTVVCEKLIIDQKKRVMQRFFDFLKSEGTEETKVLSIQLLILPMLENDFKGSENSKSAEYGPKVGRTGVNILNKKNLFSSQNITMDCVLINKFMNESLFHCGLSRLCGQRLNVELLKLTNVLMEFMGKEMVNYQNDLIKYAWPLLKNEDITTKHWAYVFVCRFITIYDTPSKIILQVFVALIRSYQQEVRNLVSDALGIITPQLSRCLPQDDFLKVMNIVVKVFNEEGNSLPQLSHMWHIIVCHQRIFFPFRDKFIPYLVISLSKLCLPMNSSPENRELSIDLAELLLNWEDSHLSSKQVNLVAQEIYSPTQPKKVETSNYNVFTLLGSPESSPSKKMNISTASPILERKKKTSVKGAHVIHIELAQSHVDNVVNFLVSFILSLARSDNTEHNLKNRATKLFERYMSCWRNSEIRPSYFDEIDSMCINDTSLSTSACKNNNQAYNSLTKTDIANRKGDKSLKSNKNIGSKKVTKQLENTKAVTGMLLSTCIDLFTCILTYAPGNNFFRNDGGKVLNILSSCFCRAIEKNESTLQENLKSFLIHLFSSRNCTEAHQYLSDQAKILIEETIANALDWNITSTSISTVSNCQVAPRSDKIGLSKDKITKYNAHNSVLFILQALEQINTIKPEFVQLFSSNLIVLAEKLTVHTLHPFTKKKNISSTNYSSASPLVTLFEEACKGQLPHEGEKTTKLQSSFLAKNDHEFRANNFQTLGSETRNLISCLRLIGSSISPLLFTENREIFFSLLGDILDRSQNITVLLTATAVVGHWLCMEDNGSITRIERNYFIPMIMNLNNRELDENMAQPLFHMVTFIIAAVELRSSKYNRSYSTSHQNNSRPLVYSNVTTKKHDIVSNDTKTNKTKKKQQCDILKNALLGCLMTTHMRLREIIHVLFSSKCKDYQKYQWILDNYYKNGCSNGNGYLSVSDISGRAPMNILLQLLNCDFERLGGRLWTMIFTDVLISISYHSGDINLINSHLQNEDNSNSSIEASNMISTKKLSPWIPSPRVLSPELQGNMSGQFMSIAEICPNYLSFRESLTMSKTGRGRCLTAIRNLAACDASLSQALLEHLFAAAWSQFPNNEIRSMLTKGIVKLLSRPFHSQFLGSSNTIKSKDHYDMNSVRSFLCMVTKLQPLPTIDLNVLGSLASDYNCWHEVKFMLEQQLFVLRHNPSINTKQYREKVLAMVRTCYLELGERDIWMTMKSECFTIPGTKRAISLDMYGKTEDALDMYNSLIDQSQNGEAECTPLDLELSFWEDRWIALHKDLCQWDLLASFAEQSGSAKLQMECAWKVKDWEKVRSLCSTLSIAAALESGDFEVKMSEVFLAIIDGNSNEIENIHAQTAQLCLYKWQLLPPIFAGCNAHISLLHYFHRLVDLRESGQIMVESRNHSSRTSYPDFKNLLSAWRYRLPNISDQVSLWEDIFQWRSHMFTAITKKFQWVEQGALATLHDRPWTSIRMAKTARKQGTKDVALLSLGKLTDCAMDVSDAFSKLREQILSYKNGTNLEKKNGLNLVNTTNLSYFDANQKSELFRLKAHFLESLGEKSKATHAYCHAVQLCPGYSRAWTSWGGLCSSLADIIEKQNQDTVSGNSEAKERASKKGCQYLAQAMGCYLEAIRCDSNEFSRNNIAHCLWMLAKDGSSASLLCSTFEKRSMDLPSWIWFPWIPQLLTSLCRIEGNSMKRLLNGIVLSYPQAVYYSLRAFYLERWEIEKSRKDASDGVKHHSVIFAEELMTALRKAHPVLWSSLETVLEELITRFRPSHEEELLATMNALLQRAESQMEHQKRSRSAESYDSIKASFTKTLTRVFAKFFRSQSDSKSSTKDDRGKRTEQFIMQYKNAFESDFSINFSSKDKNFTIYDIITKLKKWQSLLQVQVELTPTTIPLLQASPSLSTFSNSVPDLWPGACDASLAKYPITRKREVDIKGARVQSPSTSAKDAESIASAAIQAVLAAAVYEVGGGHYGGGMSSIEIPGQYPPNSVNSFNGKPYPELHTKLVRFDSTIEVSKHNDQLVRRIGMVGNDGTVHYFLLQFGIPYWTRTDERAAQLHHFLGKVLQQEIISSRRNLWLKPTAVIPIAQRLRMTAEDTSHTSLEYMYQSYCSNNEVNYSLNSVAQTFQKEVNAEIEANHNQDASDKLQVEKIAKLKAYEVCTKIVDPNIFVKYIQTKLQGPESFFHFQKNFASQVALNSILQYGLHANERNPSKFVFSTKNAQVLTPDFRLFYSNQGYLDSKKVVPFRMTRNIENMIGPHLLNGVFLPAMSSAAAAICSNEKDLDPVFRLLLRDDIVSWFMSKSSQREGNQRNIQELERQLGDRVAKNVALVQGRLRECVPTATCCSSSSNTNIHMITGAKKLLNLATSPDNLAEMPLNFCSWL